MRPLPIWVARADALALAAGEGAGGPVKGEIFEADVYEELKSRRDLLENLVGGWWIHGC